MMYDKLVRRNKVKRILEMRKPLLSSFPVYGDLFSILEQTEHVKNWMCNNFIQLNCVEPIVFFESYRSVFYNCPHLSTSNVIREEIKECWDGRLIDFIKQKIDYGYYIFLYVDRKYIQQYKTQESFEHEMFIYGYDDDNFYCADNMDGGKYTQFICSQMEIDEAYWKVGDNNYACSIYCIKVISSSYENNWFEGIKMKQIFELFAAYADSRITLNFAERFDVLQSGFCLQEETLSKLLTDLDWVDWRPYCVFLEHKKMMSFRLQYINEVYMTDDFSKYADVYKVLEEKYKEVVGLIIKYNIIHNNKLICQIREIMEEAIKYEKDILDGLKMLFSKYAE